MSGVITITQEAPLFETVTNGARILVLGEPLVGKTTLISAGINSPTILSLEKSPAFTVTFSNSTSSISEISGLHTFNKDRGQVWRSVVNYVDSKKIDVVWFCTKYDFLESNDELWHWLALLSQVCHVILVRTKCLAPTDNLQSEALRKFPSNPPPPRVVCLLAQDMQLNPKGGGATVEGYGLDDLVSVTNDLLNNKKQITHDSFSKLFKQVESDEERYKAEEAQKRVLVNALRSLSSTETDSTPPKDPLAEEEFVFVPPSEAAESGFVKVLSSKKTRAVVGALVAFAVIRAIAQSR